MKKFKLIMIPIVVISISNSLHAQISLKNLAKKATNEVTKETPKSVGSNTNNSQENSRDRSTNSRDRTQSRSTQPISNDAGKLFEQLFENININIGSSSDIPNAKGKIDNYKEKLEKLLSLNYEDAKASHSRMSKGTINGTKMDTDRQIAKVDEQLAKFRNKEAMEYAYYTMQYHLAFWDAAQKVFSEDSSYGEMYQKVNTAVTKMGSLENMGTKAGSNNEEYIKNTKLPSPIVKDAKLEKVLMDGFNKKFGQQYKVTALKAVLTQEGWTTLRNSITSVITGRERSAKIAYKGGDGKCYMIIDYVFIKEEYIGGSFTNTKAIFTDLDGKEMLCENIK